MSEGAVGDPPHATEKTMQAAAAYLMALSPPQRFSNLTRNPDEDHGGEAQQSRQNERERARLAVLAAHGDPETEDAADTEYDGGPLQGVHH